MGSMELATLVTVVVAAILVVALLLRAGRQ
jgi:hypothetical protein